MVLGGGANHRRPADVDILDAGAETGTRRHGFLEGIQVHRQQIDPADSVPGHGVGMGGHVAQAQQAAVDLRMQRLDAPVQHLGKSGVVGNLAHLDARVGEGARGTASGKDLDSLRFQRPAEFDEPRLVGNGDQSAADGKDRFRHTGTRALGRASR